MIADCDITCGSWGEGLAAFDRLFEILPWIGFAVVFIGAIWIISAVQK